MNYIRELTGLRGLLALWVVFGHLAATVTETNLFNPYAVDIFIILSGFSIAAMIDKKQEPYGLYLSRRILRIFPTYLLFLILSVAAARLYLTTWQFAPQTSMRDARIYLAQESLAHWPIHLAIHLTGLQSLVPPTFLPGSDFAFIGQAWSLSLEWQFYLIAPFLVSFVSSRFTWKRTVLTLSICAILRIIAPWRAMRKTG
jgi:peptidoglycan/LPS O-acetylase OafA/YrhL